MGTDYQPLSSAGSCMTVFIDAPECFICRDVELQASDPPRNFCDCKSLLAHHACLSTWIQRGYGGEDRLRCIICKAKYHVKWSSPWRWLSSRWQTWMVLTVVLSLLGLVPYVVHCMVTVLASPPPPSTFKVAAASFGLLTEILLIKCLSSYLSARYRHAELSSFTVQPRGPQDHQGGAEPGRRGPQDQGAPPAAGADQADGGKADVLQSGCLSLC